MQVPPAGWVGTRSFVAVRRGPHGPQGCVRCKPTRQSVREHAVHGVRLLVNGRILLLGILALEQASVLVSKESARLRKGYACLPPRPPALLSPGTLFSIDDAAGIDHADTRRLSALNDVCRTWSRREANSQQRGTSSHQPQPPAVISQASKRAIGSVKKHSFQQATRDLRIPKA